MNNAISFHHIRNVGRNGRENLTVAFIKDTVPDKEGIDHKIIYVGVSRCSAKDQFNKAKGRLLAEGRAAKARTNLSKGVFMRLHRDSPYADSFTTEVDSFAKKDVLKLINDHYLKGYLSDSDSV